MDQSPRCRLIEVPQELKEEIIGHLGTDREALKACSLSHSSFLAICQRWLFANVHLNGNSSESNGQNFKTLLQDSPHLANYIQSIKLLEGRWEGSDRLLLQDTALLATLPLLRSLSSFHLRCQEYSTFSEISTELVNCLSEVLRLPSLEYVELKYAPLQLLENAGPSLKHISLGNLDIRRCHPRIQFLQNPLKEPLLIESLQLLHPVHKDMELLSNWLQRTDNNLSFKQLKRLYISRGDKPSSHLAKIWTACQASLEELVYVPCCRTYALELQETSPDYLDFSTLTSLRALRLRFNVGRADTLWQPVTFDPSPWLIKHLGSLPPSNIIEELAIQLNFEENLDPATLQAWQDVEVVILKNLKCLRRIDMHIRCATTESYHASHVYEKGILQNTQSTGFFRLLRVNRPYNDSSAFSPFSTWNF